MDAYDHPTDNIWTSYAQIAGNATPALRLVSSRSLPERDWSSAIVADAAVSMSMWISDEDFKIKGLRRARRNPTWSEAWTHHAYATVIAFLVCITENRRILTSTNATYLTGRLNAISPELGTLLPHPDDDTLPGRIEMSWVSARSARLLEDTVSRFGMSFRHRSSIELFAAVTFSLKGAMAAAQHAFDLARWDDPGTPDKTKGFVDQLAELAGPAAPPALGDSGPASQSPLQATQQKRTGFPPPQGPPSRNPQS
jgi:hypothetical protein